MTSFQQQVSWKFVHKNWIRKSPKNTYTLFTCASKPFRPHIHNHCSLTTAATATPAAERCNTVWHKNFWNEICFMGNGTRNTPPQSNIIFGNVSYCKILCEKRADFQHFTVRPLISLFANVFDTISILHSGLMAAAAVCKMPKWANHRHQRETTFEIDPFVESPSMGKHAAKCARRFYLMTFALLDLIWHQRRRQPTKSNLWWHIY